MRLRARKSLKEIISINVEYKKTIVRDTIEFW